MHSPRHDLFKKLEVKAFEVVSIIILCLADQCTYCLYTWLASISAWLSSVCVCVFILWTLLAWITTHVKCSIINPLRGLWEHLHLDHIHASGRPDAGDQKYLHLIYIWKPTSGGGVGCEHHGWVEGSHMMRHHHWHVIKSSVSTKFPQGCKNRQSSLL